MSHKLDYFKHMEYAKEIHLYLIGLTNITFDDSSKDNLIGYEVAGQSFKFATLIAESYQPLVLHIDPRNRNTPSGKEIQVEIQKALNFNIEKIRNHVIKHHEVYIPLEKLNPSNTIGRIEKFTASAYHKQDLENY